MADVTPSVIGEARDSLLRGITNRHKARSPATVTRYMASLSHAFTIAVNEWGWLDDSPMRKVKSPKLPRGRVRVLSDAERDALLKACRTSDNAYLYPVVVLALSTGMRRGEIMGLKWMDVDLSAGHMTLNDTKNGEIRVVPLTGHALDVLKQHNKVRRIDSDWVFPSKVNRDQPQDIRAAWLVAIKQAHIEDFKFHDLRHTAASMLAMNGASLLEIADVLGHKTLQMVKRYSHFQKAHTYGVVKSMNEKIFGADDA